jgi:GNAT superfamily N-acetyltransferase
MPCKNEAMHEIRIRAAEPPDISHVMHHRSSMFAEMGRGSAAEHIRMLETTETYLQRAMPAGRYIGWLAETAEGRVVAGAGVAIGDWPGSPDDPTGKRALVLNVYTEPEFRRQGIARRLMAAVIAWSRDEGLRSLSLHASDFGRALYEELGFRQTNEMRLYLKQHGSLE